MREHVDAVYIKIQFKGCGLCSCRCDRDNDNDEKASWGAFFPLCI